jgi:dihydroneopterin aldolase
VYIDLQLYRSLAQAGKTDQLDDTLDYSAVAQTLEVFCKNNQFELLETLAHRLIAELFQHFKALDALKLTLHKPQAIANAKDVGLSLYRERANVI